MMFVCFSVSQGDPGAPGELGPVVSIFSSTSYILEIPFYSVRSTALITNLLLVILIVNNITTSHYTFHFEETPVM